jgi:deoxyadenosine/deoxycytidine kinase
MKVIVLTGNIGCGKTSTINSILCQFEYDTSISAVGLLEDVDDWKWLLAKFYNNKSEYVYLLQTVIFTHFIRVSEKIEKLRDSAFPPDFVIVERSPLDAKHIFIENIRHLMTEDEYSALQVTAEKVINMYPWNEASYYMLDVPVEVCHERTNRRKRPGEDKIDLEYLRNLHQLYSSFPSQSIPVDPTKHIAMVGEFVRDYIVERERSGLTGSQTDRLDKK